MSQAFIQPPFSIPRIYRGSKEWFIEFFFYNREKGKNERFRIRGGINRIKDLERKETAAKTLQMEITAALRAGETPARLITYTIDDEDEDDIQLNLIESLFERSEIDKKGKSQDTDKAYKLMIGRLRKYLLHIDQPEMMMKDFHFKQAQEFKEYLQEELELSNVSVNCSIQPIKKWFEFFRKSGEVERNPFQDVEYLPKHRGSKFIAFDDDEKKRISEHLKKHSPELYLFANIIYSCFIRPKEICALTPSDIDLNRGFIQVRIENSKVNHTSFRQIMPPLAKIIRDYRITSLPKNQPIFLNICGNEKDLRTRRRRVSDLWLRLVVRGLEVDKAMYGLKHTGNIDYLKSLENVTQQNLMFLKQQNDHTSLETTQRYIQDIGIYKMRTDKGNFGAF